MSIYGDARKKASKRDLVVMSLVEALRGKAEEECTPLAVASMFKGRSATPEALKAAMDELVERDLLELVMGDRQIEYALSPLGAEVLDADMHPGWQPNPQEQMRRDAQMRSSQVGKFRQ